MKYEDFTDEQKIAIIHITRGDTWYACDDHFQDYIEEYTMRPLAELCGECGRRATHFGPNPFK